MKLWEDTVFSRACLSVCLSTVWCHVTITHDALDLIIKGPPGLSCTGHSPNLYMPLWPSASVICWSRLETCSNLFTWRPLATDTCWPRPYIPSANIWWLATDTFGGRAGGTHPTGMLSCPQNLWTQQLPELGKVWQHCYGIILIYIKSTKIISVSDKAKNISSIKLPNILNKTMLLKLNCSLASTLNIWQNYKTLVIYLKAVIFKACHMDLSCLSRFTKSWHVDLTCRYPMIQSSQAVHEWIFRR